METANLVKAYMQCRTDEATGQRLETIYFVRYNDPNGTCWTSGERPYNTAFNPAGQVWSVWAIGGGLPAGAFEFIGEYEFPDSANNVF